MRKLTILKLFEIRKGRYLPCGLGFIEKLWWRFMPGVTINVRWPKGELIVDHNHPLWQDMGGAVWVNLGESADPNDHYRPELERLIGKQGIHWNWGLANNDILSDRMTIKIIKSKAKWASYFSLKWS